MSRLLWDLAFQGRVAQCNQTRGALTVCKQCTSTRTAQQSTSTAIIKILHKSDAPLHAQLNPLRRRFGWQSQEQARHSCDSNPRSDAILIVDAPRPFKLSRPGGTKGASLWVDLNMRIEMSLACRSNHVPLSEEITVARSRKRRP